MPTTDNQLRIGTLTFIHPLDPSIQSKDVVFQK